MVLVYCSKETCSKETLFQGNMFQWNVVPSRLCSKEDFVPSKILFQRDFSPGIFYSKETCMLFLFQGRKTQVTLKLYWIKWSFFSLLNHICWVSIKKWLHVLGFLASSRGPNLSFIYGNPTGCDFEGKVSCIYDTTVVWYCNWKFLKCYIRVSICWNWIDRDRVI